MAAPLSHTNTRCAQVARPAVPRTVAHSPVAANRLTGATPFFRKQCPVVKSQRPVLICAAAAAAEAVEAPMAEKLRIKLKSYEKDVMQTAVQMILDAAAATGASVSGPAYLPTRRKIYCVLRSPHVNKDSREHFEMRIHQRIIDVRELSAQTIDRLMELEIPAGVDAKVKLM